MGLKIGEIDIFEQSLNNEYQHYRMLAVVNLLLNKLNIKLEEDEVKEIDKFAMDTMRKKYPNSGIKYVTEVQNEPSKS